MSLSTNVSHRCGYRAWGYNYYSYPATNGIMIIMVVVVVAVVVVASEVTYECGRLHNECL